ncbi:hypothetical protein GCM10027169_11410 [Gordonia jinhuaensis]
MSSGAVPVTAGGGADNVDTCATSAAESSVAHPAGGWAEAPAGSPARTVAAQHMLTAIETILRMAVPVAAGPADAGWVPRYRG